jgi:hypothetical protein
MSALQRLLRENWLTLLVVAGLAVGYMVLKSSPADAASLEAFMASPRQGQPVVVEFYSNA